ncbi:MAG: hypothetical protein ACT4OJ_01385 [Bacteroidota bacterium]
MYRFRKVSLQIGFLILSFFENPTVYSQKIILRPGFGFLRTFNSVLFEPNENGFKAPANNINFAGSLGIEYLVSDKLSIEAGFENGILGYSYTLKKGGNSCLIEYTHFEGFDVLQLNIGINRISGFFPVVKIFQKQYSGKFKVSIGTGINKFGREESELNESQYFYKSVCPDGYDSLKATTRFLTKTANWGFHCWVKTGIRVFNQKRKELFDLSLFYNLGLTKQYAADIDYYLNNDFYTAKLESRGSQMGFRVGFPIRINKKGL